MESIARAYWPTELFDYVRGIGAITRNEGDVVRALTDKGFIEVDGHDMQYCMPYRPVADYWTLVELVAKLAAANPDFMLCYRGQRADHHLSNGIGHSLCPTLWREKPGASFEDKRNDLLEKDRLLMGAYSDYGDADGRILELMRETPLARWALLQHYGICDTPLLDLTHSLQVACSFASGGGDGLGYVYIFGLPYQTQAISTDAKSSITCMSLLGVTPSNARRPLIQEGYLVCDGNWWRVYSFADGYTGDHDVDFSARLLAVVEVSLGDSFWENCPNDVLSEDRLMPSDDPFLAFLLSSGLAPHGC